MQDFMNKKMSRRSFFGTSAAVATILGLAACGNSSASDSSSSGSGDETKTKRIAVLCDDAGKNDNGYNQAAVEGAQKVGQDKGWEVKIVEPTNGVPDALESLGEDGYDIVFNMAYDFEALINGVGGAEPLASQYPDTEWVIFNDNPNKNDDGSVKHKNVIAVLYDLNESSFLAGALSVLVNENAETLFKGGDYSFTDPSTARACGFIGGTNSAGIVVFSYGYITGINYEAEKLGVTYDYYAKYDAGFTDSAGGATVAGTYYGNGSNVVFGCAGSVGDGITSKAKEVGKLAIQVDGNKDDQQPGYVLTSVLKNTNVPVQTICDALDDGSLSSMDNLQDYSLASGATGLTDCTEIQKAITTDEGKAKWEEIWAEIEDLKGKVGSEIKVVNAQNGETFDPSTCPNVNIK